MAVYILSNDKSLRKEIRSTFALPSVTFMNKIQVYFLIQEEKESKGKRCDLQVFFFFENQHWIIYLQSYNQKPQNLGMSLWLNPIQYLRV